MTISTILSLLTFGFALTSVLTITATNSVISVIFLITTFVQVAIYLILLGINFIAISYIVIYVGAIAVLFLFVIMMINIKLNDVLETGYNYTKNLPLAIVITCLFIGLLYTILPISFNLIPTDLNSPLAGTINIFVPNFGKESYMSTLEFSNLDSHILSTFRIPNQINISSSDLNLTFFSEIEVLGHNLYTYGAIYLIILSIILLLAMLATIVLSKNNKNI